MAITKSIIADTSGIISLLDKDDKYHRQSVKVIVNATIFVPTTILPEVDYLVTKYLGEKVAKAFLEDLLNDNFSYLNVDIEEIKRALEIMNLYRDVPLGIVDASLVALAEVHKIHSILTLDRRHFSLIKSNKFQYLELLP